MYIIIAGCGKIGANLVKTLSNEGHDVVVIDPNEESFAQLENGTNCLTVTGMCIDEDVLKSAGIEHADALLAVTSDDNVNIMTAQIAKQLYHVPHVVTRIYDPDKDAVFCVSLVMVGPVRSRLIFVTDTAVLEETGLPALSIAQI